MIQVDSFFLKPNVYIENSDIALKKRNQYFIHVNDLIKVSKHIQTTQPVYPGMIEIKTDSKTILGINYHDSVDGLWYGLIQLLISLKEYNHASAPFIYRPYDLALTLIPPQNEKILLSITQREDVIDSWILPKKEFITALLDGAKSFFSVLNELQFNLVQDDTEDILEKLDQLSKFYTI